MALSPEVAEAIAELKTAYPESVSYVEDGVGGALVIVDPVALGAPYAQASTWVGFHVTHLHPNADIYPHHVRGDLSRVDGQPLGSGTSPSSFQGKPSQQLSRRSNRRDAATDSVLLKLERVMQWLRAK
ncbi:MAG: hypothetical protein HY264_02745 [Chloroflexi bacterium]|nr:hypothetical protein [Chloroflexota bacterium]